MTPEDLHLELERQPPVYRGEDIARAAEDGSDGAPLGRADDRTASGFPRGIIGLGALHLIVGLHLGVMTSRTWVVVVVSRDVIGSTSLHRGHQTEAVGSVKEWEPDFSKSKKGLCFFPSYGR